MYIYTHSHTHAHKALLISYRFYINKNDFHPMRDVIALGRMQSMSANLFVNNVPADGQSHGWADKIFDIK